MTKKTRQEVFEKYNGLCAYTGKPLDDKWQVDHMISKNKHHWNIIFRGKKEVDYKEEMKKVNDIENLFPALYIVNHYKRSLDLEGFRRYMRDFHKRLAKLPKKTMIERTRKRKEYMLKVAEAFDITPDKPFNGKFYFETL